MLLQGIGTSWNRSQASDVCKVNVEPLTWVMRWQRASWRSTFSRWQTCCSTCWISAWLGAGTRTHRHLLRSGSITCNPTQASHSFPFTGTLLLLPPCASKVTGAIWMQRTGLLCAEAVTMHPRTATCSPMQIEILDCAMIASRHWKKHEGGPRHCTFETLEQENTRRQVAEYFSMVRLRLCWASLDRRSTSFSSSTL